MLVSPVMREDASLLIETVLSLWLDHAFACLPKTGIRKRRRFSTERHVAEFADWLSHLPLLDAAFWLSSAYAQLVDDEVRAERALFFTPPDLARRIVANVIIAGADLSTAEMIDPACGGASFIVPSALAIRDHLRALGKTPRHILRHIETHVFGFDIDPTLCKLSRFFVWMALHKEISTCGYLPDVRVFNQDARREMQRLKGRFDMVLCNPPYRKISAKELPELSAVDRVLVVGQPNLYSFFMAEAVNIARSGGHIGLLTPTSFLSGRNFSKVRGHLLSTADVLQIELVERRQGVFIGVEQETAVTILSKVDQRLLHSMPNSTRVLAIGSELAPEEVGHVCLPRDGSPWVLPRSQEDNALVGLFAKPQHTLATYGYDVRVGYLVPHRNNLPTYRTIGRRSSVYPLIWATDIGQDGSFEFDAAEQKNRFVKLSRTAPSGLIQTASVALQRTTAKDDTRRLIAAAIPSSFVETYGGYVGENHIVFLIPKAVAVMTVEHLAAILHTHTVDRLFRCISGSMAVSAMELAHLPLPDPAITIKAIATGKHIEGAVREGLGLATAAKGERHATEARDGRTVAV